MIYILQITKMPFRFIYLICIIHFYHNIISDYCKSWPSRQESSVGEAESIC